MLEGAELQCCAVPHSVSSFFISHFLFPVQPSKIMEWEALVNGIYKLRAHAHRHGGSMGAYGTSQGWGGAAPGLGGGWGGWGVTPSRYFCLSVSWFVTGPLRAG